MINIADMLNDTRSHGLWEKTAPPPPMTSQLNGDVTCDVVIIGAGYTGLSAALHLGEGGAKVIVLEAAEVGFGGAGRNVGLVNAGMWVMPNDIPAELGPVYGERVLDLLGHAPQAVFDIVERHGIACQLEKAGTLHCAVGPDGLAEIEQRAAQWQARGANVRLLDASETALRTGSSVYAGSLHDQRTGTIQPLAYVRGLAHAALSAGAQIFTGSQVLDAAQNGARWKLRTMHGAVTADWVIVASDAYAKGPWAEVRAEQIHLPYFNFATPPLSDNLGASILRGREGAWDTKEILTSFRRDRAGRLIVGSVGALRNTGMAVHRAWARRTMAKLFPQLRGVAFESAWYGQIGMTDNNLPRFHRYAPNVIGFSGYNGRGIAPGTVFGRVLADHIGGKMSEADLPLPVTDARAPAFRVLKEAYYEAGAQLAHFAGERF